MLRLHLTAQDVARLRVVVPGPLAECQVALGTLQERSGGALWERWRARVRDHLPPDARALARAWAAPACHLDLYTTVGIGHTLPEGVERLLSGPRRLRAELPRYPAGFRVRQVDWMMRGIGGGGAPSARLGAALTDAYEAAVGPFWDRVSTALAAQQSLAGREMTRGGVRGLVHRFAPWLRWSDAADRTDGVGGPYVTGSPYGVGRPDCPGHANHEGRAGRHGSGNNGYGNGFRPAPGQDDDGPVLEVAYRSWTGTRDVHLHGGGVALATSFFAREPQVFGGPDREMLLICPAAPDPAQLAEVLAPREGAYEGVYARPPYEGAPYEGAPYGRRGGAPRAGLPAGPRGRRYEGPYGGRPYEGARDGWRDAAAHPLAALVGRTRAAVLATAREGATTGDIARLLRIAPASASKHATTLREAGLLSSRRDRGHVWHSATPVGRRLLDGTA